mmetsp:Transcript_20486/g.29703  ORF Transcript_20486/g.29703 Transcript_20486/m.29703 type:complete len:342 (+) Transcript_20486:165-1190(+)
MSNSDDFNTNLPSMHHKRHGCAAAAIGSQIFVAGGRNDLTIEIFDTLRKEWIMKNSIIMNTRECCAAVSLGDKFIVIGGSSIDAEDFPDFLSSMVEYDTILQQWSPLPSMNNRRMGCAAGVVDGKIFVAGGFDGFHCSSSAEEYDPATQRWADMPPMHFQRFGCAAAVLDGKFYVFGGCNDEGIDHPSAEVYDPASNQWSMISSMKAARQFCAAVPIEGKIIVMGGGDFGDELVLSTYEIYDPTNDQWSSFTSEHNERWGCAAVEIRGTIYLVGGHDRVNPLNTIKSLRFMAILLDKQPGVARDMGIDDNAMPSFISYLGHYCKFTTMWEIMRNRQDLFSW